MHTKLPGSLQIARGLCRAHIKQNRLQLPPHHTELWAWRSEVPSVSALHRPCHSVCCISACVIADHQKHVHFISLSSDSGILGCNNKEELMGNAAHSLVQVEIIHGCFISLSLLLHTGMMLLCRLQNRLGFGSSVRTLSMCC